MGGKWEAFVFIVCDSEPPSTTLTERRASYACLYKCLFPVAGWEEGLTLDQGFQKASSLVDKWWESQKGRLGGQSLCTGFYILLHSKRVLPDKVITCLSQRDLKDQVTRPLFYGQDADEMGHDSTPATSEGPASSVWWWLIGNCGWKLHQIRMCYGWGIKGPLSYGSALQRHPSVHKIFSWLLGVKGLLQGEARTLCGLGVWVHYCHSAPGEAWNSHRRRSSMSKSWTDPGMTVIFLVYFSLENT